MKKRSGLLLVGLFSIGLFAFTSSQSGDEWVVPAKYVKMANPTDASDDEGISIGKDLYTKHCKSCHGKEGLGDGTKAKDVKGDLGDFSSSEFQKQTDGQLFYKSKFGRDDMPNFEKKITSDEDMWFVVNYMRTLAE
jgi:mono/diheme cytochrome c family protein